MEVAFKKEVGITSLVVVLTMLSLWLLSLVDALASNFSFLLLLSFLTIFWISCLALALAVVGKGSAWTLICFVPVFYLLVQVNDFSVDLVIAAVIVFLVLISARMYIMRELESRVSYKTRYVFTRAVHMKVLMVIIMITGIALPWITESMMSQEGIFSDNVVNVFIKPYEPYLQNVVPTSIGNLSTVVASTMNDKIRFFAQKYSLLVPLTVFAAVILLTRLLVPFLAIIPLVLIAAILFLLRKFNLINIVVVSEPVERLEL